MMTGGHSSRGTSVPPATHRSAPGRLLPDPARRRDDLLAAGAAVFTEVGVEAATIAAITARAGTAKGNFYRYFDSKEALLAALKAQFVDEMLDEVVAMAARVGADDWWELVDTFVAATIDSLYSRLDRIRIFAAEPTSAESLKYFLEGEARIDAVIAAGIQSGVDAGVFDVADPEMTATILQHGVFATIEHAVIHDEPIDRDRLVVTARTIARRALGGG
jgi:AcrR family transcriptional regulator